MVFEINKKEYGQLFDEKMTNGVPWIIRDNVYVNSFINEIFKEDRVLWRSIFDAQYNLFKGDDENKNKCRDDLNWSDFYYECAVSFKRDIVEFDNLEDMCGIINFTFISWESIEEFINKTPKNWNVFILNPMLMRCSSAVGLFLMPLYEDRFIDLCNHVIQSNTDYPLFLKYVNK